MISKCQNIVINRTKFSDFEEFYPEIDSTEGLKLVGFIETTDLCTGETIKKNVSVDYPNVNPVAKRPENLLIDNLYGNSSFCIKNVVCNDGDMTLTRYTVTTDFEGDLIQINNLNDDREIFKKTVFSSGYLNIGFTKNIPFGRTIQVIFNNFPASDYGIILRQVDYDEDSNHIISAGSPEILIEKDERLGNNASILITFTQSTEKGTASVAAGSSKLHKVVASEIQILN